MNRNARTAPARGRGRGKGQAVPSRRNRARSIERPQPVSTGHLMAPRRQATVGYNRGWTTVSHTEVILLVYASDKGDTIHTIPIIPRLAFESSTKYSGEANALHGHGLLYTEHRWTGLHFKWTPSCANVTPGNVAIRFMPNYSDPSPTSLHSVMSADASIFSPFVTAGHTVVQKKANSATRIYRNIDPVAFEALSDADKNEFSMGKLIVGTGKQTTSLPLGVLQLSWSVELKGIVTPTASKATATQAVS